MVIYNFYHNSVILLTKTNSWIHKFNENTSTPLIYLTVECLNLNLVFMMMFKNAIILNGITVNLEGSQDVKEIKKRRTIAKRTSLVSLCK